MNGNAYVNSYPPDTEQGLIFISISCCSVNFYSFRTVDLQLFSLRGLTKIHYMFLYNHNRNKQGHDLTKQMTWNRPGITCLRKVRAVNEIDLMILIVSMDRKSRHNYYNLKDLFMMQ